jgi:two-component system response regulator MprA
MMQTLLVVDDHESARELIADALRGEGYELVFAATGTEASARVAERLPDMALLDVALPGVHGSEVCRQIKALSATTPVVLMSGALERRELERESNAAGADAFLAKPFFLDELRTVLRLLSHMRAQRAELAELRVALAGLREMQASPPGDSARAQLDWRLPYHRFMKLARKAYFEHALEASGGNKSRLARESGLDRSTLYVHLRNLGMLREPNS